MRRKRSLRHLVALCPIMLLAGAITAPAHAQNCQRKTIYINTSITGELDADDCLSGRTRFDEYELVVNEKMWVVGVLGELVGSFAVYTPAGTRTGIAGGLRTRNDFARSVDLLAPGRYRVRVSMIENPMVTSADRKYKLVLVHAANAGTCVGQDARPATLNRRQSVTVTSGHGLTPGTCRMYDKRPAIVRQFKLAKPDRVRITVEGSGAQLEIIKSPGGMSPERRLKSGDEAAVFTDTLAAGTYAVAMATRAGPITYTIETGLPPQGPAKPSAAAAQLPVVQDGTCVMRGGRAIDLVAFDRGSHIVDLANCQRPGGQRAGYLPLVVATERQVSLEGSSSSFAAHLLLRDAHGSLIQEARGSKAVITRALSPGLYYVGASRSEPGQGGSVIVRATASGGQTQLTPNVLAGCAEQIRSMAGSFEEAIAFTKRTCQRENGDYVRYTRYLVPVRSTIAITAMSTGYDAALSLLDGKGNLIETGQRIGRTARITRELDAGAYYMAVVGPRSAAASEDASYRLRVTTAAASGGTAPPVGNTGQSQRPEATKNHWPRGYLAFTDGTCRPSGLNALDLVSTESDKVQGALLHECRRPNGHVAHYRALPILREQDVTIGAWFDDLANAELLLRDSIGRLITRASGAEPVIRARVRPGVYHVGISRAATADSAWYLMTAEGAANASKTYLTLGCKNTAIGSGYRGPLYTATTVYNSIDYLACSRDGRRINYFPLVIFSPKHLDVTARVSNGTETWLAVLDSAGKVLSERAGPQDVRIEHAATPGLYYLAVGSNGSGYNLRYRLQLKE